VAKRATVEEVLSALHRVEIASAAAPPAEGRDEVGRQLGHSQAVVVAKAARVAGKRRMTELLPKVAAAFATFLDKSAAEDKGCVAKIALVEALNELEHDDRELFRRGMKCVQREGGYGGSSDSAAKVRAESAIGLARTRVRTLHNELAPLLLDREATARDGAVRALAYHGGDAAEGMLRLKALFGDAESAVTGQCLLALMRLNPSESIEFVAGFLDADDGAVREEAALALAESRHEQAFDVLRARYERRYDPEFRAMLFTPIALTRREEAAAFLEDVVATGPLDLATAAYRAGWQISPWRERMAAAAARSSHSKVRNLAAK
jgi:hypothetical protein